MLTKPLLAGLLLFSPAAAFAQGALLQSGKPVSGQTPMYSGAGSQAVVQASGPAGGGGVGLGLAELLQVNRVAGTGPNGSHVCLYDHPTTNAAGYHYFCLDAGAGSRALMSVGNGGGAAAQPFQFIVNGTTYDFPFVTGGIVGPGATTVGHLALWDNTTGTLLKDSGAITEAVAITPAASAVPALSLTPPIGLTPALGTSMALSGTATANHTDNINGDVFGLNFQRITADTATISSLPANLANWFFDVHFGGPGMGGGRSAIWINYALDTAIVPASSDAQSYNPFYINSHASANAGGTGTTPSTSKGSLYGGGSTATLSSGATNYRVIEGYEIDVGIDTGGSAWFRKGLGVISYGNLHGASYDAGISLGALSDVWLTGWLAGISFDSFHGAWPIDNCGVMIMAPTAPTGTSGISPCGVGTDHLVDKGIDWANVTFTTASLALPGFTVTGGGAVTANSITAGAGTFSGAVSTGALTANGDLAVSGTGTFAGAVSTGALTAGAGTFSGAVTLTAASSPALVSGGLYVWNIADTVARVNPVSWINTALPGTQGYGAYGYLKDEAMLANVALTGEPAIFGASRTADDPAPRTCCSMGLVGVAVNDNTTTAQTAWPLYATGARQTGTGAVQVEFDVANVSNDVVDISPYSGTTDGPPGSTVALNLGCGGEPPQVGNTPNGKCSAFLFFNNNGSISRKGLVISNTALDTALGSGGNGVAVEVAFGQSLRWLKSDGTTSAEIWTDNTGLHIKSPTGTVTDFP